MKIPKEIAQMVCEYQETQKKETESYATVSNWLTENTETNGVYIDQIFIAKKPQGEAQGDDEYCIQSPLGLCEDSYTGKYYHKIEDSNLWLGYSYEC